MPSNNKFSTSPEVGISYQINGSLRKPQQTSFNTRKTVTGHCGLQYPLV